MERVMSELAGFFCKKNEVQVHLVLYGNSPEFFYNVPQNLIIHKPEKRFNNTFRQISTIRRLFFLRRVIVKIDPDSILSFGEYWNSFVLLALTGLKYSVYISDRCGPDRHLGFFHQFLREFLYIRASGIIFQTSKAKDFFQKLERRVPTKIIGNPIRKISTDQKIEKENIVLTVGRIIPSKNHDKLIRSFLRLNQSGWKLVIVGGDALKMTLLKDLKNLVYELGAEDKVILTGDRSDVDLFYLRSKVFVLTSESEGFPNVIGEAMAAGLPVVSFDCIAGPSELITNGKDGFLIPVSDYIQLELKLEALMNNEDLRERIGSEARKRIKEFSIEKIGEEYYSFIMSNN